MFEFIKSIIDTHNYNLSSLEERIQKMYILGKLTAEEMQTLLDLANANVNDTLQIDVAERIADIERRLNIIESKGLVWVNGTITAKGQTVLFDIDNDGILDMCMYGGGRATTSSKPGNIEGWYKVNADGVPTHTISKENGQIVLTAIED